MASPSWESFFAGSPVQVTAFVNSTAFVEHIQRWGEEIDCLVFLTTPLDLKELCQITMKLCELGLLWPAVVVICRDPQIAFQGDGTDLGVLAQNQYKIYHNATLVRVVEDDLTPDTLVGQIQEAVTTFVQIAPTCELPLPPHSESHPKHPGYSQHHQLAHKLRERLGYLGVYYQRDPQRFYRHLSPEERKKVMQRLRGLYQAIILDYFNDPANANARIDEFAALAFLSDLSVSHVLELHMTLMDAFAQQLKLEGRSQEILLDYRITLIDVIAHLAELYRRALPKEKQ